MTRKKVILWFFVVLFLRCLVHFLLILCVCVDDDDVVGCAENTGDIYGYIGRVDNIQWGKAR